jgi:hypothetical protein
MYPNGLVGLTKNTVKQFFQIGLSIIGGQQYMQLRGAHPQTVPDGQDITTCWLKRSYCERLSETLDSLTI